MEIPAIENFSLINTKAISGISPYIELTFSDPLDPDQETEGLFMMQGVDFEVLRIIRSCNQLIIRRCSVHPARLERATFCSGGRRSIR